MRPSTNTYGVDVSDSVIISGLTGSGMVRTNFVWQERVLPRAVYFLDPFLFLARSMIVPIPKNSAPV